MHRIRYERVIVGLLLSVVVGSQSSQAQFSANFQTNVLSSVGTNWIGNYYVGSNTFADVLLMHNSAILGIASGYVGYDLNSSNNTAVVTDVASVWTCSGALIVGNSGANNSLIISNAGRVSSGGSFSYVGFHASSSNNSVHITGTNSKLTALTNLYIGYDGSGNTLWIDNGGVVLGSGLGFLSGFFGSNNTLVVADTNSHWTSTGLAIGGGIGISNSLFVINGGQISCAYVSIGVFSDANSAFITDPGSIWNITTDLRVGSLGRRNTLVISNSAQVVNANGYIGPFTLSDSNSARVADGGVWRNNILRVGDQGSSNTLVVAGGSVYATNLTVGFASPSCDNLLELDSGNVAVTNTSGNGVLEVRRGTLMINGGNLQADVLLITNPCAQLIHTAGSLIVSNVVLDRNLFRIVSLTRQGNDLLVTWKMGPGITNALQVTTGAANGSYTTNGFTDIFVVTNNPTLGTVANYLDIGAANSGARRYYRARLAP